MGSSSSSLNQTKTTMQVKVLHGNSRKQLEIESLLGRIWQEEVVEVLEILKPNFTNKYQM